MRRREIPEEAAAALVRALRPGDRVILHDLEDEVVEVFGVDYRRLLVAVVRSDGRGVDVLRATRFEVGLASVVEPEKGDAP